MAASTLSAANTGGVATTAGNYNPASFKAAPAGSYEAQLYNATPAAQAAAKPAPVTPPGGPSTSAPVATSSAAQADYAAKQSSFADMQAANAAQASQVQQKQMADAQAKQVADTAAQAQANINTQNHQKQQEITAKNAALGVAVPNYGDKVAGSDQTAKFNPNTGAPLTPPAPTAADKTASDLASSATTYAQGKSDLMTAEDSLVASTKTQLDSIANGTFPLNVFQQGLINSVNAQLASSVQSQTVANAAYTGAATESGFRQGGEYTPVQYAGQIANAVSYGIAKIQELDGKAAATIADLQDKFNTQNYDMVTKSYDLLQKQLDGKSSALKDMYDTVTSTLKDARDQQQKAADKVSAIALEAAKNGATPDVQAKINASPNESAAIAAAGDFLQTATGTMGDYLQYKRDATTKGLVPMDYQTYKDQQDAKAASLKVKEAYNTAYASEAGKTAATQASGGGGGYNGTTQKQQISMEQQYRQILGKEFSARTGALGTENAKVNQANHLNSLFSQYYDPKTGNYNIPTAQYAEIVTGLANLISPTGAGSDQQIKDLNAMTAKGDLNGAIQYITGVPQNGNTQDIIKNLVDTVDRQATTAQSNRQAALDNMKNLAPTDLDPARVDSLNKATNMVTYTGQDRVSKANVNSFLDAHGNETIQTADGPHSWWYLIPKLAETPGATPMDIESYLKGMGKLQ